MPLIYIFPIFLSDIAEVKKGLTVDRHNQRAEALLKVTETLVDHVVEIFRHRLLAFIEAAEHEDTITEFIIGDLGAFTGSLRTADPPQDHPIFRTYTSHERKPYAPKEEYPGIQDKYMFILRVIEERMASLKRALTLVLAKIADETTIIPLVGQIHETLEIVMAKHFVGEHLRFKSILDCLETATRETILNPQDPRYVITKDFRSTSDVERLEIAIYVVNHWMRSHGYTYDKIADEVGLSRTTVWRALKVHYFSQGHSSEKLWNWLREKWQSF